MKERRAGEGKLGEEGRGSYLKGREAEVEKEKKWGVEVGGQRYTTC